MVQIFETPQDNGSDRHYFFAKELVKRGNGVTVITGNIDYKRGIRRFRQSGSVLRRHEGVDVLYAPVFVDFRGSYFKRSLYYISFIISALLSLIKSSRNSDVIYAASPPLTVPLVCSIISKLRDLPLILEVCDVWPDAAIHTGVLRNKLLVWIARRIEMFCYKRADHIICLTRGIQENIVDKGIDISKTSLVTNGVDVDLFKAVDSQSTLNLKSDLGLGNKFIAMYLGAHGRYNALHTIVEAAKHLEFEDNITLLLVGDGEEKNRLKAMASQEQLKNLQFLDPVARKDSVGLLSVADCFLLPNLSGDFFEVNLPNKLFDYLASERPVIVSGFVESGLVVKQAGAGFVLDPEEPMQLADVIKEVSHMAVGQRTQLGKNGGRYVRAHYDRRKHVAVVSGVIERVIRQRD